MTSLILLGLEFRAIQFGGVNESDRTVEMKAKEIAK